VDIEITGVKVFFDYVGRMGEVLANQWYGKGKRR
jgi:hypothetical protein